MTKKQMTTTAKVALICIGFALAAVAAMILVAAIVQAVAPRL